jgi:Ca2+-transporting ATPase
MRDTTTSIFKFRWSDNKVMILAFFVGLIGQLFVTEIPFLTNIFGTASLSLIEWIAIIGVSMMPLVVHEILVPFQKRKVKES